MSNQTPDIPSQSQYDSSPRLRAERRFFTAVTGRRPTDDQVADVVAVREAVLALAVTIDVRVPAGRNKSLAMTALEDVIMRANRGIHAPEDQR